MSGTVCYVPVKGIDDVISSKLIKSEGLTPHMVATIRGLYEEYYKKPLDTSDLNMAAIEISRYRGRLKILNAAQIHSAGTNLASNYKELRKIFTSEEKFNRVNMIAGMFSSVVDEIQKHHPEYSRKAIIDGFTDENGKHFGEFTIFEKVFNQILQLESYWTSKNDTYKAHSFKLIIDNWPALVTLARVKLRDTEGAKLGNDIEFSDDTDESNFSDYDLDDIFKAEETPREHWITKFGTESSFGSIGKQVRRFLSNLPVYEFYAKQLPNGQSIVDVRELRDDLRYRKLMDPVKAHQTLSEIMRGITSNELDMLLRLVNKNMRSTFKTIDQLAEVVNNKGTKNIVSEPWLIPVLEALVKNPQLRTQFLTDIKRNFQAYYILTANKEAMQKGLKWFNTFCMNKIEDLLGGAFMSRVLLGKPLNPKNSVFDSKGNIVENKLREVISSIKEWLYVQQDPNSNVFDQKKVYGKTNKFYSRGGSYFERRLFLSNTLEAIGIDIDADTLDKIMSNSRELRKMTNFLEDLVKFGISDHLLKRLADGETISYKSLINQRGKNKKKEGVFKEKIRKINEIITRNREGLRLENRVRHTNSKGDKITLSSLVTPSYMGDMFDRIQAYVLTNDKAGLKEFINKEYLGTTLFKRNGVILNKWLEDLIECCDSNEDLADTFAGKFNYMRFLGTSDTSFENFTSKQHMIDMLTEFRSDKEISENADTALYPVFILGDAGISKYIRAKRYDRNTILNGLYNVYVQEIERKKLVEASNDFLEKEGQRKHGKGYKKIKNLSGTKDTFTMLQFLNKDFKSNDGKVGKYYNMLSANPTESEVKKAIKEYLKDSVAEFKTRLQNMGLLETKEVIEYKDNKQIKTVKYVYLGNNVTNENLDSTIADFYWNVKFATIQQLQLMTIDPGFYKNTKDLQKRYKEVHAPGTILDIDAVDIYGNKYSEDGIERAVYFDDIVINAEETNSEFMEVIKHKYGEDSEIYKNYKKCTLTDGQGYRTLESYRKVMGMAGKWTEEMQRAYETIKQIRAEYGYDKDKNPREIPAKELAKIAKLAVVFQPIKPYMFTHERLPVNDNNYLPIPVQHKYAEAVLIPELLPAGSKLRDMAYWMDENNIDLVGSTEIVKVGAFGSTDISKVKDRESLNEALSKAYVHQFNYEHYRIQTNVPEHINSSQLFGTQLRKIIMSNIKMNDYHYESYINSPDGMVNLGGSHGKVRLNGRNLVAFYNSLVVANILKSTDNFEEAISKEDNLSKRLIQNTINNSRESVDNIYSYAIDENGDFTIPLFEGALEYNSSALIFSMFKKLVNKQSIKGGSAVQVSAMGISGYEEDNSLKFVTNKDKTNILYAECEIPFDFSYTDENGNIVELDYNDYCNEDGTLKMGSDGKTSLIEERFPGILDIIAYRIPTEREYSIMNLKVKRFSKKTEGGTIKVPAQSTKIAGFDFDIDKLYFMMREYKAKKGQSIGKDKFPEFESYSFEKSPLENSRTAINNMLIDLIQQRLMDEETLVRRTTPGGFVKASEAARIMRELLFGDIDDAIINGKVDLNILGKRYYDKSFEDPEPNYDPSDPMTIITYNQQNQVASKLIGIFANQNTNHAFASLMKTFKLFAPIEFAGHSYNDFLHAPEGIDVDTNVAEFLAASVDAVKDPVLNFLNFNTITADAGAMLARLGYTTTEIGLLFNQPIIREVCEYSFNEGVDLSAAIRDVVNKYRKNGINISFDNITLNPNDFTTDKLVNNIVTERKSNDNGGSSMDNNNFATEQIKVLKLFSVISSTANEVSNFITSTKFTASNAVGSTFGHFYAQQMKVQNYLNSLGSQDSKINMEVADRIYTPVNNSHRLTTLSNEEYLDAIIDNPFAYEQAMFDSNRKALKLMSRYFPYEKAPYVNARTKLASLTRSSTLDEDTINSIHRDMLVYLLSVQERSEFNGDLLKNTNYGEIPIREYYTKYFAKDLLSELSTNSELKDSAIFKYIIPVVDEDTEEVNITIQGIGGLPSNVKEEIIDSWADLSKDPKTRRIAIDLFMYNFYKLGFDFSHLSFMNLAPTELKQIIQVPRNDGSSRSYVEFLRELVDPEHENFNINTDIFVNQYLRNHLDNKKFGVEIKKGSIKDYVKSLAIKNGNPESNITIDITSEDIIKNNYSSTFILRETENDNKETLRTFTPVIKLKLDYGEVYYVAEDFNPTTSTTMKYRKVEKLGTKGISVQYYGDEAESLYTKSQEAEGGFEDGGTNPENDLHNQVDEFNREAAVKFIMSSIKNDLALTNEDKLNNFERKYNTEFTDIELEDMVNTIKETNKENGIYTIDEDGKLIKVC